MTARSGEKRMEKFNRKWLITDMNIIPILSEQLKVLSMRTTNIPLGNSPLGPDLPETGVYI